MDKFSLKDSGRGDSEAGDSDCDMGRESPVDRLLLGEGFSDLIHLEMHHRLHPGEHTPITSLYSDVLSQPRWQHTTVLQLSDFPVVVFSFLTVTRQIGHTQLSHTHNTLYSSTSHSTITSPSEHSRTSAYSHLGAADTFS